MQPRTLDLPGKDGIRLSALEWSNSGVPLVFVHGFGNDAHVWDEVAPAVAPYYRTVALSLRGHGDSDWGEGPGYSHTLLAEDLERALDSLGFERLVLVGHSLGGRVCMRFAGAHPARMAGLVIVDAGPELDARGTRKIRDEVRGQMRQSDPSFASPAEYVRVLVRQYPAARVATLERLAEHWTRRREDGRYVLKQDLRGPGRAPGSEQGDEPPHDPARAGEASEPAADSGRLRQRTRDETKALWDALARVPCPTLVVRGAASDVLSADVADRMVDDVLAKGQLVVVPAAGHSVMLDNPEAFTRALCDFALG